MDTAFLKELLLYPAVPYLDLDQIDQLTDKEKAWRNEELKIKEAKEDM